MAEYVKVSDIRELIEEECYSGLQVMCMIDAGDIPPADVVERSKIDKAIEELQAYRKNMASIDDFDHVGVCVEFLKRNIGGE